MDNSNSSVPDQKKVYEMVKDGSATMLSAAALILTVTFGIITFGSESAGASMVLKSLRVPVIPSGGLLITSMISGGIALATIYDLIIGKGELKNAIWSYRIQYWAMIGGLISLFVAVLVRMGVFNLGL